nr:MAG TPA: hypothetical protein [Caudoviricetes sp.]
MRDRVCGCTRRRARVEAVGLNPTPTLKKFGSGSMNAPLPLV